MKYGLSVPQFDAFGDIHRLVDLAQEAEEIGWDGFFIWDHMLFDDLWRPVVDPWVTMAAIAVQTKTIRLGPMVTPFARRRPWKLAREAVSIDHLSNGRLIMGVGLGAPEKWEFGFFGEETDAKIRARKLDEGLAIFQGLLSGEPFSFEGEFYKLEQMRFLPRPVQKTGIPIWIGGVWPNKRPIYRAAKYDGYFPDAVVTSLSPQDWEVAKGIIADRREKDGHFDLVQYGVTPGADPSAGAAIVAPYQEIGITWWVEGVSPFDYGFDQKDPWTPEIVEKLLLRVRQGPPIAA